jgi:hypothetical protein
MHARLLRAYRRTRYEAGGIVVRIGRCSGAMDELLLSRGVRRAVFITAYNPFSRKMPAGWNERMQRRLAWALHRRAFSAARGMWRGWSEEHLVVFGDPRPTCRIARRFRQNSVVLVRLRQAARLVEQARFR